MPDPIVHAPGNASRLQADTVVYAVNPDGSWLLPSGRQIGTNQVLVTDQPTMIVPANTRRGVVIITLGLIDVYLGDPTVTVLTGALLAGYKGGNAPIPTVGEVWGICATGLSQRVSYLEVIA